MYLSDTICHVSRPNNLPQHSSNRANSFPHTLFRTLCRRQKVNSFGIKQIQTLSTKHPGWGIPTESTKRTDGVSPKIHCASVRPLSIFMLLVFMALQTPFRSTPFPFTSIQNPRGGGVDGPTFRLKWTGELN